MPYSKTQLLRIKNKDCIQCSQPRGLDGTTIICRSCAQKAVARSKTRNAKRNKLWMERSHQGICTSCGNEVDNKKFKTCSKCLKYAKDLRYKHKDRRLSEKRKNKICLTCSKPAIKNKCKKCWMRDMLNRHKIDNNLSDYFWQLLEKQEYKCFYTGIKISPEENASIDHVTPTSKGGTNELSNLVWCDRDVNTFKSNNTYNSLIKLAEDIIFNHNRRNFEKQTSNPK